MPSKLTPYIKHHRRTDKYTVYAPINGLMKAIGIYTSYSLADQVRIEAARGNINTTRYPNHDPKPTTNPN